MMKRGVVWATLIAILGVGGIAMVSAATFTSPNFSINGSVGDSAAGRQTSTNYEMTSASGQSVAGPGTSGSYKLGEGYVAQLEQSLQLTVQPQDLGFYLPFDEGAGTAAYDSSINSARATLVGSPTWTTGKVGGAISTASSTEYVATPASAASQPTGDFTVETWVYPTNLAGGGTESQKFISNTNSGGMALYVTGTTGNLCAADKLCFVFYSSGAYRELEANKTLLTDNVWTHLAATYDGTVAKLFADGVEVDSLTYSGTVSHNGTTPTCFGAEASPTACNANDPFFGRIDEAKIFNRGLTNAEVEAEYMAQNAAVPTGLSLNTVAAGTSQTAGFDTAIQTDAPGYNLSINQNNNLTNGGNTIPAVSGSIASPVTWSEGTTKGLGFTLYGTNATSIPGTWSSGNAYAALPGSATSFYTRTGYNGGAKDYVNMRLRLDTAVTQTVGDYTNQMTVTGTMTP